MSDKRLRMPEQLLQITMNWTYLGQQCRNVMYLLHGQPITDPLPWNDGDEDEAVLAFTSAYVARYGPLTAHDATLNNVSWVWNDLGADNPLHEGTTSDITLPFHGGETHDGCANNVSLAIKFGTGLGGRGNFGRFMFVGINNGLYDVDNPNVLKPGSVTDFTTANEGMLADLAGTTLTDGSGIALAVASFVHNGSLRTETTYHRVTSIVLHDTIFDSQRRRLPGRGI